MISSLVSGEVTLLGIELKPRIYRTAHGTCRFCDLNLKRQVYIIGLAKLGEDMTIKLGVASALAIGGLSACGSSSSNTFVSTSQSGFVGAASFEMVNGQAVPDQVTITDINDVEQTVTLIRTAPGSQIFTDGSDVYQIAASADGANYALLGFDPFGFGFLSGSYIEVTSEPVASGTATYTGPYFATLWAQTAKDVGTVTGNLSLTADFTNSEAFGVITGRANNAGVDYNTAQINESLVFTGSLDGSGNFDVLSTDFDTSGRLIGVVHDSGAVGIGQLSHVNGAIVANEELIERSAFALD